MAFIIKDRVKEGTTSTGTGDITLSGSLATFDTFQSYMTNGDTTYYAIVHTSSGVDEWEVGLGTWNTGNTLTRTTVLAGSNGTSAENFSAGSKDVFMTYPAAHAALAGDDVDFANITVTGTVDGRDVATDGSKLDTVEQNADVTDAINVAAAGALMKSGGTMTGNLILNGDPTVALGAATKEYVDTIAAAGIHYHTPVRVEAPLSLTVTYNNGASGVGATLTNAGTQEAITIDGVALSSGDRVLVYEQTDATQNGIYTVTTVGSGSTNWVLTRATDADSYGASDPNALGEGDAYFVKEGATGAGELYVMNTAGTITFGTTNITFTVIAETAVYSAGTGLTLTGTTFAIGQDVGTTANVTFNQVTAAIIGNVDGDVDGDVTGNAGTATKLATARTIQLSGDVTGSATFDGSANASITAVVQDDSHSHVISNVDGLQTALNGKTTTARTITAGDGLTGGGDLTANRTLNVGAGSGITVSADAVAHADTSSQASSNNSGRTYIQDVTLDTFGHVTGLATATETVTDTTYSAGNGLSLSGTTFSHTDTSTQASVNNSNGTVIQDITLDTYGHIAGINSVNLDGRYYTESEADSRFVNVTGDTMTGRLTPDTPGDYDQTAITSLTNAPIYYPEVNVGTSDTYLPAFHMRAIHSGGYRTHMNVGLHKDVSGWGGSSTGFYVALGGNDSNPTEAYKLTYGGEINHTSAGRFFADNYHPNADKWTTARTLSLTGDVTGSVSWDGSGNASLSTVVGNDSHNHNHSDGSFTVNGTVQSTGGANIVSTSSNPFRFQRSGLSQTGQDDNVTVHVDDSNIYFTHNNDADGDASGYNFRYTTNGVATNVLNFSSSNFTYKGNTVWHQDNDGSGSGLDADLLDGVQGSSYLRSDASDTHSGTLTLDVVQVGNEIRLPNNSSLTDVTLTGTSDQDTGFNWSGSGAVNYISNGVLKYNLNNVWHTGNDGSGSGLDADLLDGVQGSSFLRSNADDSFSGGLVSTSRDEGIFGTYDSTKTDHIWSMGTAYKNHASGTDFGNLYGLAYKHTNNTTGGTMASGHQMVWCQNGTPYSAMGTNIWTSGSVIVGGTVDGRDVATDGSKLDGIDANANNYSFPYTVSASASNSTVVQRHSSGYIYANYFNTTPNDIATGSITKIVAESGNDGFMRHATAPAVRSFLNVADGANNYSLPATPSVTSLNLADKITHTGDTDTYFQFHGANLARMVIAGAEVQEWGANYTLFSDNDTVRLGSGSDFRMWFDGSNTYFRNYSHANGDVFFQGEGSDGVNETAMKLDFSGTRSYVNLYENAALRLNTTDYGVNITGDLTASGEVISLSDVNFKENITSIETSAAIAIVNSLRPVSYNMIGEGATNVKVGFIAQEVEKTLPEVVHDNNGVLGVSYGNMIAVLTSALQNALTRIEELENAISNK